MRAVGGSVNLTGSQVEELRREREKSRVSFSASLVTSGGGQYFGPFSRPTTLIYRHVFTNTGNTYNPNTGMTVKTDSNCRNHVMLTSLIFCIIIFLFSFFCRCLHGFSV